MPGQFFVAMVIFADTCGAVTATSIINIPDSWREKFSAYISLPCGNVQLSGEALYGQQSVGLVSTFTAVGTHLHTKIMRWSLPVTFLNAISVSGGRSMYIGYSGEGVDYYDALLVMCHADGTVQWAQRHASIKRGADIAYSAMQCSPGLVVVGVTNKGVDGFIMLLDDRGHVLHTHHIEHAVLRNVRCTSDGGFVAVGDITISTNSSSSSSSSLVGLFVLGDSSGGIIRVITLSLSDPRYPRQGPIQGYSSEQLNTGHFVVLLDSTVTIDGAVLVISVIVEINAVTRAGAILSSSYFGEFTASTTYTRSMFTSAQGGLVLVGALKRRSAGARASIHLQQAIDRYTTAPPTHDASTNYNKYSRGSINSRR